MSDPVPPRAQNNEPGSSDDDNASAQAALGVTYRDTDRFKTFRKHTRELYQTIATSETIWPTKSVQVMPYTRVADAGENKKGCVEQTVLCGTSTAGQEQNYVKMVSLVLPTDQTLELQSARYDEELNELGSNGMAPSSCRFKIEMLMAHDGDVKRARYMPHNPSVIATASSNDMCYIFDRSSVLRTAPPNTPARPLLPLLPPKPDHFAIENGGYGCS